MQFRSGHRGGDGRGGEGTDEVRVGGVGADCSEVRWQKSHNYGIYPKPPSKVQLAGEG